MASWAALSGGIYLHLLPLLDDGLNVLMRFRIPAQHCACTVPRPARTPRHFVVKSGVLRALAATCDDPAVIESRLASVLKRRAELDLLVALYLIKDLEPTEPLKRAVKRLIGNSNKNVRTGAYVAVGTLQFMDYVKSLKRRLPGEKGMPKAACQWALSCLGEGDFEGDEDPETYAYDLLPDNNLYEGDLEAMVDENGRKPGGRGGRSGGRSGGRRGR